MHHTFMHAHTQPKILWFWPPLAFSVAETSVAEMSGPKHPRPKCPWPKCPTFVIYCKGLRLVDIVPSFRLLNRAFMTVRRAGPSHRCCLTWHRYHQKHRLAGISALKIAHHEHFKTFSKLKGLLQTLKITFVLANSGKTKSRII